MFVNAFNLHEKGHAERYQILSMIRERGDPVIVAELAATHRLCGADAVYVAVARRYGTTLVSRDDEQRNRRADVVACQTPEEAIQVSETPRRRQAGP